MKRWPFYALVCFFILLYTQGLWARLGVPKLAVQATLFALPLSVLLSQRRALGTPAPGFLFLWFYLGWSLSACIYHDEGVLRGLLYPRFLIGAYLVFWATWSSRLIRRQLFGINAVILTLFFVQVLAALFYWLVLGQKLEYVVGTLGFGAGGIAATFPMFAFGCLLAFYLYYNRPLFLVGAFSFFAVSHASGKLAVYYFIPLMLILGLVLYAAAEGLPLALRRSRVVVLVGACALPLLVFLLSHTPRMEGLSGEAGLYRKIAGFLDYTQRTSALEAKSWYTTTRLGTSKRVMEETFQREPSVFLFGQGTSVFRAMSGQADQGAYDKYGIIYGTVGWSGDALAIGWPAIFAHVGLYGYPLYLLLRNRRRVLNSYGKALRLTVQLGFFVFLINYFLYAPSFTTGGWVNSVYLYFLAVLLAPQYAEFFRPALGISSPPACRARYRPRHGPVAVFALEARTR